MKTPSTLSELSSYRNRQAMNELLRREIVSQRRVRVKANSRRIEAAMQEIAAEICEELGINLDLDNPLGRVEGR